MPKSHRIRILSVIAGSLILTLAITGGIMFAAGGAPHTIEVHESKCFRSINEADDLYCGIRFNLPTFETLTPPPVTPEAWCQELNDKLGCITDPVDPVAPQSLNPDLVFVTFWKDCLPADCSVGTLLDSVTAPRIGHAISGVYMEAGHGVSWEDSTVNGCVEVNPLQFTSASQICMPVLWAVADNDVDDQRNELGVWFLNQLLALEIEHTTGLNFYVQNNRITDAGKTYVLEALNIADRLLGGFFRASSTDSPNSAFATVTATPALQGAIKLTATVLADAYERVGEHIGGGATDAEQKAIGGTVLWLIICAIGFGATYAVTTETLFPSLMFACLAVLGLAADGFSFTLFGSAVAIFVFPAASYTVKKLGLTG